MRHRRRAWNTCASSPCSRRTLAGTRPGPVRVSRSEPWRRDCSVDGWKPATEPWRLPTGKGLLTFRDGSRPAGPRLVRHGGRSGPRPWSSTGPPATTGPATKYSWKGSNTISVCGCITSGPNCTEANWTRRERRNWTGCCLAGGLAGSGKKTSEGCRLTSMTAWTPWDGLAVTPRNGGYVRRWPLHFIGFWSHTGHVPEAEVAVNR